MVYNIIYYMYIKETYIMNNIYEPDTKFNKIFMFIGNTITITTGCIGVISWIITQITKNIPQVPTWLSITFKYLFHFCVVAFIFGIIFILIRIIYVGIKSKSESLYIQRKTTEFLQFGITSLN